MVATTLFKPGHNDRVTVVHTNFNGTKILTGSIDHRIKVWERDPQTGERTLLDTFTAHDADIKDVRNLQKVVSWILRAAIWRLSVLRAHHAPIQFDRHGYTVCNKLG